MCALARIQKAMDPHITENNNIEDILTFGNLFEQDLPQAYILPVYPSSFNKAFRFRNENKYRIFNIPKASNNSKRFLVPLRCCCVAGNELPILVHKLPSEFLSSHWKKWCPHFIEPVVKTIEEGIADKNTLITLFPLEAIPDEKHAIEPEMHYHILKKAAVAETGAPYPKYFTEDNVEFPCMIKMDQSLSGYGNYVTRDHEEFEKTSEMVKDRFGSDSPYIISEYIQDVQSTLDCGFYVTKSGRIIYMGVQVCILEDFGCAGGTIDWDIQGQYKERLYDKFVVPVAAYLHKKGFFGVVGIDVVTSPGGDYLVDLNPRINGNSAYLMLASSMAKLGLSKSLFMICASFHVTSEQLVKKANSINEMKVGGRVIIMAAADDGDKCHATVSVFGDSEELVKSLYNQLCSKE